MTNIPIEHVEDAQLLVADGEVDLFQLSPIDGSGTIFFKGDNAITWQGDLYEGLPIKFNGLKKSVDTTMAPKLVVGDQNIDLSAFKPLVYDGYLDGALLVHVHLLLDNLINDRNIRELHFYRVKRVENYNRLQISMQLATASDALGFTLPFRAYQPPAFPSVTL